MTEILIRHGDVIKNGALSKDTDVLIRNGKIAAIGKGFRPRHGVKTIDARGCFVSPGFIDTHIHGNPKKILPYELRHGTTSILVAISCAGLNDIYREAEGVKRFIQADPLGQSVLGVRIEGPYINRIKAGAQDRRFIRKPSGTELLKIIKRCSGVLKMVTVAPELSGAAALIKILRDNGIVASVGHSNAREEEAIEGVGAGATHATHLFNAMRRSGRLSQSVTGACLTDNRITAEAILDLVHVPASLLRLLAALKSPDKIVAITDSVRASVDRGIRRSRGAYRFGDGRLAGSCLTMIKAVENAVGVCGFSVTEAVSCAAENPARLLGEWHRIGSIAEGKDADIAIFNKSFVVLDTIIRGDHVWHNRIRRK